MYMELMEGKTLNKVCGRGKKELYFGSAMMVGACHRGGWYCIPESSGCTHGERKTRKERKHATND